MSIAIKRAAWKRCYFLLSRILRETYRVKPYENMRDNDYRSYIITGFKLPSRVFLYSNIA